MTKSERKILLWLSGVTRESYYDNDSRIMIEGISSTHDRIGNAAIKLREMGFMLNIEMGSNPTNGNEYTYWITKPEITESVRSDAITRSVLYEVRK